MPLAGPNCHALAARWYPHTARHYTVFWRSTPVRVVEGAKPLELSYVLFVVIVVPGTTRIGTATR